MRISLILLLCCVALYSCKKDNPLPGSSDSYDFSSVEKVLDDSVPRVMGGKCFALIAVDGKVVFQKGYGNYDGNTRQLVASCSKWLSGAVVMSMVDEGKFKLSDTIGKYLPVFSQYGKGNVTIAQCFSHTSGFPGASEEGYENNQLITLETAVNQIAQNVPLEHTPGTVFNYGSVGMQIAGRICEVVSGKSWSTLFKDKIADPCGMTQTDYGSGTNPLVAGGARSTPNDYLRFLVMLMQNGIAPGGTKVLSEQAVQQLEANQTANATILYSPYPVDKLDASGIYGIGNWRDLLSSDGTLIENSSPGAFGSHPWINRGKKITGIIFTFILTEGGQKTFPTSLKIRELCRQIVP